MGMGLDGIAAEGWIPAVSGGEAAELHDDMWDQLKSIDTFLLGRKSYQLWKKVWPPLATKPTSSRFEKEFSRFTDQVQKIVFSKTLKTINWENSRLVTGNIAKEVAKMKRLAGKNMAIVGGPGIAQTFTKLDLIDRFHIYLHPAILGSGKPLLGGLRNPRELELVKARTFKSGVIVLDFQRRMVTR
jgi:dihydrofolate reductase